MNNTTQDPLREFFASEWETSLFDAHSLSPNFSEAVLKKIADNKRRERFFNIVCVLIALSGIAAVVIFVFPGYKQFDTVVAGISSFMTGITSLTTEILRSLSNMFRLQVESDFISLPLLTYLSLLTIVLWSLDGFLRRRRQAHLE